MKGICIRVIRVIRWPVFRYASATASYPPGRQILLLLAFLVWFAVAATAAEPTLTHLFPVAGTQGTTVSVVAAGKYEPWPPQVWVDTPGVTFRPSKNKGTFDVEIASDAAPGPHLVRFYNTEGVSAPRFFIVSSEPELLEKEPNDQFKSPQKLEKFPATISGRLDKAGDVDSFAVPLKKGETLTARVEAYVLASTFDGMLRVVDQDGTELAFNHDDGRTIDPLLRWEAPRDGTFVVQLMGFAYPASSGVNFTGGEGCVYRLHFTTSAVPSAHTSDGTEPSHQEAGNTIASKDTPLTIPATITSRIQKAGDENRHVFTAVKQHAYELNLVAARDGSLLDAWLKIENKEGKQLARVDDSGGSRDPQFTWNAPADGDFIAVIGDVTHHGGADYGYRLTITEVVPGITATTPGHAVSVTAGKTSEVKATVKRTNGFKSKLQLVAHELPPGVSAPEIEVPEKGGEVTLKIVAEATAPAASQPFHIFVRETESGTEHPVSYSIAATGENNGVTQGYTDLVIDSTDQLWLTVIAAPPKPEPPKAESPAATPSR